jgi:hypothetical protein
LKPRAFFSFVALAVAPLLAAGTLAAQSIPEEAYGPYNAIVLPDGLGLIKPLAAPPSLDPRYRGPQPPDPLTAGSAPWTLAFWFQPTEPLSGITLLAGFGDPAGSDARFIGVEDNRLGLWLGSAQGSAHLLTGTNPLGQANWHFAAAVSDGRQVTLYADGAELGAWPLMQGTIAAQIQMAPAPQPTLATQILRAKQPVHQPALTTTHFGGRIAALKIYREPLSADQIKAIFDARLDFSLPTYEEASPHWGVQTRGQAGMSAPQDPSTLPRGKAPFEKPVAEPLTQGDLRNEMAGENPWTLQGGWRLAAAPQVTATGEEISKPGFQDKDWLVATVPGTVLTTMVDRGIYPDPDYGLDNMDIPESLAHQDYWYRVEFKEPAAARGRKLTLTFLGVNYAAEVWLNGKKLGGFKGAFLRGTFDVTGLVKDAGENALAVRVSPPPHAGIAEEESLTAGPGEDGGVEVLDGPTFAASEGWDWIPSIRDRNTGIWQGVTLTASGPVQIGDMNVVTVLPKPDRSEADIEIDAPLTNATQAPVDGELTAWFDDVKVTKQVRLDPGDNDVRLEPQDFPQLKVQHPRLWWPNGYGDPALHTLHASFTVGQTVSSTRQIEFGMREVSYELSLLDAAGRLHRVEVFPSRTYDEELPLIDDTHDGIREIDDKTPNLPGPHEKLQEDWAPHTWVQTLEPGALTSASVRPVEGGWPGTDLVIKVNGVRIAARGGNWGMDDMLKRVSTAHLEPFFRLHRDAHVNIIRNWMGQSTEESFYALADKYGLMVWNDFWDSTENYNLEAQDPALFLRNARDAILRFRHHPSIVVWCGRNEGVPQAIINQGLAELLRTLDHTRYYTPSSNQVNLRGSGPYLWEPPQRYFHINRGFSVELGMPSVPTLESFESFIPAPDRWPISDTWAYHDWHQSEGGRVSFYMDAMDTEFGAATGFEDFVRKAQMLDYAGHRAIFEGMAAHLWQPNSGRMIWMTQPAWPSTEWNFLSWDYDTQSSFYATKKALEPIHAQLNLDDDAVDLIDLGEAHPFSVRVRVVSLDDKTLSDHTYRVEAAADDRTPVTRLDLDTLAAGHTVFVVLEVTDDSGAPVSRNFYWWAAKDATLRELDTLPPATIQASATLSAADGERKATVSLANNGTVPAVLIKLTLEDAATGRRILPAYYSDNYISLLPGEQRAITVEFAGGTGAPGFGLRGWNLKAQAVAAH